jgi:hypothetical protein
VIQESRFITKGIAQTFKRLPWGPRRRHRLGTFYVEKQEIITLEQVQVSEDGAQLDYRIRVLTPAGEEAGEFRIPFFREPRSK